MAFSSNFYNKKKQNNEVSYSLSPPGQLIVNRLIRNLPYWRKYVNAYTETRKTLVLANDWASSSLFYSENSEKLDQVIKKLAQLIDEGFDIYIWNNNAAKRLTKSDVFALRSYRKYYLDHISLANHDLIIAEIAKKNKLMRDDIFVLDDYWMQSLINEKYNQPYEVDIHDLLQLQEHVQENVYSYLRAGSGASPKVSQFLDTEYSSAPDKYILFKRIRKSFPDIVIKQSYHSLWLDSSELAELLVKEKITTEDSVFHVSQLENIEKFNIYSLDVETGDEANLLHAALRKMKKLNCLKLNLNLEKPLDETFALIDFPKLLILQVSNISDTNLALLLKKAPHLKQLHITNVILSEKVLHDVNLNALENLVIILHENESEIIPADHFAALVAKTKNLKRLSCYRFQLTDDLPDRINLTELEDIDFFEVSLSMRSLKNLTLKSKKLKHIYFDSCQLHGDIEASLDFSGVESIILRNMTINAEYLVKILKNATSLKYLDLSGCTIEGEMTEYLTLQALVSVNMRSTSMSANNIRKILANASTMEELDLSYATIEDDNTDEDFYLVNLKSFTFTAGTAPATCIQNMLIHAAHLEHIKLKSSRIDGNMAVDFIYDSIVSAYIDGRDMSQETMQCLLAGIIAESTFLTDLTLNKLDIDSRHLNPIFSKAQKLEKLSFSGVTIHGSLTDIKLGSLHSIFMKNVKLNQKSLRNLLKASNTAESFFLQADTQAYVLPDDVPMASLKKVSLICPVSANNLGRFLSCLNNLEQLQISTGILDGAFVDGLSLPYLDLLELNAVIQADILQRLLIASQNVTTLNLNHSSINGGFTDLMHFKSLTKLILINTTIDTANFITLILSSPQLKYINIYLVKGVNFDDPQLQKIVAQRNIKFIQFDSESELDADVNAEQVSRPLQFSDPVHTPALALNKQPTNPDFQFQYKGENTSLNQRMIIEKLSQYITIKRKNDFVAGYLAYLHTLNDGICLLLARLFGQMETVEWQTFIDAIAQWDGQKKTLNDSLTQYFTLLLSEFKKTYLHPSYLPETFLGSNFPDFILQARQGKMILSNPWHSIAIKSLPSGDLWVIYDPNFPRGYKTVKFEELISQIKLCLGNLISVEGDFPDFKPQIRDPAQFINNGGLFVLIGAMSSQQAKKYCDLLPPPSQLSLAELKQGLLLRNVRGRPAWKLGLESSYPEVKDYVRKLLKMLAQQDPKHCAEILANSIAHLPNSEKFFAVSKFLETEKIVIGEPSLIELMEAVNTKQVAKEYENEFETWKNVKHQYSSTKAYYKSLINGSHKKQLIELSSSDHVQAMALALERHCQRIKRPVFYIHSPEDLVCSAPYIEKVGNKGEIKVGKNGQGGPLHDFLMANQDKANPPILIVNYDRFEASDIINFNALLDKIPKADGTPLPECATVIGLINPDKPNCYRGEDFYSRFGVGHVETCPFKTEDILPDMPPIAGDSSDNKSFMIDFCHAKDWQERLLGRWIIKKDKLYFEEGILAQALASGLQINIRNGLWGDSDFSHFWQRARTLGYIESYGQRFNLSNVSFVKSEDYDWSHLKTFVTFDGELQDKVEVLNPGRFSDFFNRYQCDNAQQQLDTLDGIIAAHADQILHVNFTRTLNEDEWAIILKSCETHRVKLKCHCAPGVSLPEVLGATPAAILPPLLTNVIIQSTDVDATVAQLNGDNAYIVIDGSELHYDDLFIKMMGKMNKEKCVFEFTQKECFLKEMLDQNKSIILKGKFSSELADVLAPLVLEYQKQGKGQLKIVTEDAACFAYANVVRKEVTAEEKYKILADEFPLDKISTINLNTTSLCKSKAMLRHPFSNPWQGMYGLSGGIQLNEFNEQKSVKKSNQFTQDRLLLIRDIFTTSPLGFIAGVTGVGKSTFVDRYLNTERIRVFKSESKLIDWATSEFSGLRVLFIDEANISATDWSMFEGLFNQPPGIVIDGAYYPLTDNHVVLFAGNPLNYGGERKMATLFERHGNAVVFYPMPLEFIYEEILKPVFADTAVEAHTLTIAKEILKIYKFLCEASSEEVLISPREIQMMALLTLSHLAKYPQHDPVKVAQHFSYHIAQQLIPEPIQSAFEAQFTDPMKKISMDDFPDNFVLTSSRVPLYQHLNDLVLLREYRRSHQELNEAQLYGGLGGLIIEGEPGVGKSEIVIANLLNHHYKQVFIDTEEVPENAFYHMPVSMGKEEKEKLLLKAFHEGAIVIVDEINSAPMMERLLNELLMGKTLEGERPKRPGFMIIGTQNPVTMSGRFEPSHALKRRVTTIDLPLYSASELKQILLERGVELSHAKGMIKAFQAKQRYAMQHGLKPVPTVRDLMTRADQRISAVGKVVQSKTDIKPLKVSKSQDSLFKRQSSVPIKENTPGKEGRASKIVK